MLDFRRDRGSNEDKRQEMLNAYLDNALTPAERARFETQLARDPRLRAEVEQLRALKLQLRAMPRRRVPRSFALNPAAYAKPKAQPLLQLYPALRGATALAAFLFIFVLALGVFRGQFDEAGLPAPSSDVAEVTRLVGGEDVATLEGVEQTAPEEEAAAIEAAAPAEATVREAEEQPATAMAAEAPDAVTEEAAEVAGAAAPEGTTAPLPETELVLPAPEATTPLLDEVAPEAEAPAEEEAAFDATLTVVAPTVEAIAEAAPPAAETDTAAQTPDAGTDNLLLLQIGLGVLFLMLLILWWLARRRARSL